MSRLEMVLTRPGQRDQERAEEGRVGDARQNDCLIRLGCVPTATRVSIGANELVVNGESALEVAAARDSAIICAQPVTERL